MRWRRRHHRCGVRAPRRYHAGSAVSADGVTFDRAGSLVSPTPTPRESGIDAKAGVITTVAGIGHPGYSGGGGPATLAMLDLPVGLVIDLAGDLLVADRNNSRIRTRPATTVLVRLFEAGNRSSRSP